MPRGKFFSQAAHMLAADGRSTDIHHLLNCIKANDENHATYTDEIILAAVKELSKTPNNEVHYFCIVITNMLSNYKCILILLSAKGDRQVSKSSQ